jgi:hypothetical protein
MKVWPAASELRFDVQVPGGAETLGIRRGNSTQAGKDNDCSRQSSRARRTVEAMRKPLARQSTRGTSIGVRGRAEVTAAATTSAPSSHSTKTGRFLEALRSVKRMSATQNSPGWIVIIQPFILGRVAAQKSIVSPQRRGRSGLAKRLDRDEPASRTHAVQEGLRQAQLLAGLEFNLVAQVYQASFHRKRLPTGRILSLLVRHVRGRNHSFLPRFRGENGNSSALVRIEALEYLGHVFDHRCADSHYYPALRRVETNDVPTAIVVLELEFFLEAPGVLRRWEPKC